MIQIEPESEFKKKDSNSKRNDKGFIVVGLLLIVVGILCIQLFNQHLADSYVKKVQASQVEVNEKIEMTLKQYRESHSVPSDKLELAMGSLSDAEALIDGSRTPKHLQRYSELIMEINDTNKKITDYLLKPSEPFSYFNVSNRRIDRLMRIKAKLQTEAEQALAIGLEKNGVQWEAFTAENE